MVRLVQHSVDERCARLGLCLEGTPAAPLDLVGPEGDVAEELADVLLLDLRFGPQQMFAVTSSRTQPHRVSSVLKSEL
jgi:hypothetical protein